MNAGKSSGVTWQGTITASRPWAAKRGLNTIGARTWSVGSATMPNTAVVPVI